MEKILGRQRSVTCQSRTVRDFQLLRLAFLSVLTRPGLIVTHKCETGAAAPAFIRIN